MKKIIKFIKFLKKIKIIFQKPKTQKIIIYDIVSKDYLKGYFNKEDYFVLSTRKEVFNFYVLISTIFNKKKLNYLNYLSQYIELINPKFIITFVDNDINFYELKKMLYKKKFIAIQNGVRFITGDFLELLTQKRGENYNVDHYLVFSESYKSQIEKYIKSDFLLAGSIKNNLFEISNNYKKNTIAYISRFSDIFIDYVKNKDINEIKKNYRSWEVDLLFYCIELIKNISIYCHSNNLKLNIIGASGDSELEKLFYSNLLKSNSYNFNPKENNFGNYLKINEYEVLINAMSTFGYEAISRDKKVGFFSGDFIEGSSFLWPTSNQKKGNFFSNSYSLEEVERVLDYLLKIDHKNWLEEISPYNQKLFFYDKNNSKLKKFLQNI